MAQHLSLLSDLQEVDANGVPRTGAKLFAFLGDTSTKAGLTMDSTGLVNHTNPIILNSNGEPANAAGSRAPIWQTESQLITWVLAPSNDTDPPTNPYWSLPNLPGINDITSGGGGSAQWIDGTSPAFIDATTFSVAGDQTSLYTAGRRVHTVNSSGDVYSSIISSAFSSATTVILEHDSGVLDIGLTSVQYGLLTSVNAAVPGGDFFPKIAFERLATFREGIGADYKQNYTVRANVSGASLVISLLDRDGVAAPVGTVIEVAMRSRSSAVPGQYEVLQITSGLSLTVPAGATLGFNNGETAAIDVYVCNAGGAPFLSIIGKNAQLSGNTLINATAITSSADSAGVLYAAVGASNCAVRFVGRILIQTGGTAGNWDNDPSDIGLYMETASAPFAQQTWVDVASTRAISTIYQNTTVGTIVANVVVENAIAEGIATFKVGTASPPTLNAAQAWGGTVSVANNVRYSFSVIVPRGNFYRVLPESDGSSSGTWSVVSWVELR